jgi:hypothetical protein
MGGSPRRSNVIEHIARMPGFRLLRRLARAVLPESVHYRIRSRLNPSTRGNVAILRTGVHPYLAPRLQDKYVEALTYLIEHGTPVAELGDYLEFGVFYGNSMISASRAVDVIGARHMRLFGFDSFEGLPREAPLEDAGHWQPGDFSMDYQVARRFMTEQGVDWKRTTLVRGWYKDTLNDECVKRYGLKKASIIMVDCDMYSSARAVLAFCAPMIHDQAVVFFDDWSAAGLDEKNLGEKKAFDEFLADHPEFTASDFGEYGNYSKVFVVSRTPVAARDTPTLDS